MQRHGKRGEIGRRPGAQIDQNPFQHVDRRRAAPDPFSDARARFTALALECRARDLPLQAVELVSDGSALMNMLGEGTPYEMVTMFHMDNSDLLATHYCGAHNQPRFRLVPSSEPNVVTFVFKDATNLRSPSTPHMVGLKITFVDANHHYQDWTFLDKGKESTSRFEFHRKA